MAKLGGGRGAQTHRTSAVRTAPAKPWGVSPVAIMVAINTPMSDIDGAADDRAGSGPIAITRAVGVSRRVSVAVGAAPVAHRRRVVTDHRTTGRAPVDAILVAVIDALRRRQVAGPSIPEPRVADTAAPP